MAFASPWLHGARRCQQADVRNRGMRLTRPILFQRCLPPTLNVGDLLSTLQRVKVVQ
jgi:hypothetical protein